MIKEIIQLLPEKQRKRGAWVAFSVLSLILQEWQH